MARHLAPNLVTDCIRVCGAQSFLQKALMPLHKPKCVGMYHQQLAYCVTQARCAPRSAHQLALEICDEFAMSLCRLSCL